MPARQLPRRALAPGLLVAAALGFAAPAARAQTYVFTSIVDLTPPTFVSSNAQGVAGTMQVGYGSGPSTSSRSHALVWSGTAGNAIDLHPTSLSGFMFSQATAASGGAQVGYGSGIGTQANPHALLWAGTAASVVDLNPAGFAQSLAFGVAGNTQVGYGSSAGTNNQLHALVWTGTAGSAVDLHPAGFTSSQALGAAGNAQVGSARSAATGNNDHALLWTGTAGSYLDLNQYLFAGYNTSSVAQGVFDNGDGTLSVVGYGTDANNNFRGFLMTLSATPEPSLFIILGLGALGLAGLTLRARRRKPAA